MLNGFDCRKVFAPAGHLFSRMVITTAILIYLF